MTEHCDPDATTTPDPILSEAEFERLRHSLACRFVSPQAEAEIVCLLTSHRALAAKLAQAEREIERLRRRDLEIRLELSDE